MAYQRLTKANLDEFKSHVKKLTPESKIQWGTLSQLGVLAHLSRTFEMSIGKFDPGDVSNFMTRSIIFRKMIFQVMSWPKGKIKAPDNLTPDTDRSFDEERKYLFSLMDEFVQKLEENPKQRGKSPIMGDIPLSFWSVMHGRHTCWHLEQYGIDTSNLGGKPTKPNATAVSA